MNNVKMMSLQELRDVPLSMPEEKFNGVTILNTGELHDSGYYMMRFILDFNSRIVGCIGGCSDVLNLNGIGGYGKYYESDDIPLPYRLRVSKGIVPVMDWCIDILPGSGAVHLFSRGHYMELDDCIICSDASIYDGGRREK